MSEAMLMVQHEIPMGISDYHFVFELSSHLSHQAIKPSSHQA
jgi:hypothetical protein